MTHPLPPEPAATAPLPGPAKDLAVSIVRDVAGKVVGGVLGAAAAAGVTVPAELSKALTAAVFAVLIVSGQVLYYVLVRLAEQRWPAVGRLLGAARAPSYGVSLPVHVRAVIDHELTEAEYLQLRQRLQDRLSRDLGAAPRPDDRGAR